MSSSKAGIFITQQDLFDAADHCYDPPLLTLPSVSLPTQIHRQLIGSDHRYVRDQGVNPYCTAMALASVIDYLVLDRASRSAGVQFPINVSSSSSTSEQEVRCSVRMLYEMAKAFDEYPDDDNKGSSLRGAIKGFFHNGVYRRPYDFEKDTDELDPFRDWMLDIQTAKESRQTVLGRYLRIVPRLLDYQSAIIDAGIIYVSATIHSGWDLLNVQDNQGVISYHPDFEIRGNHAFAIIGYNEHGFLVLNSQGPDWGLWRDNDSVEVQAWPGVALWSYADWSCNVLDAWVLRLGVPIDTTQFRQVNTFQFNDSRLTGIVNQSVTRILINGHYLHVSDGQLVSNGVFTNDLKSVEQTASLLQLHPLESSERRYSDLIFFVESGLQSLDTMARRCAQLTAKLLIHSSAVESGYRPYPISIIWRKDVQEMTEDLLESRARRIERHTGGYADAKGYMLDAYAREFLQPVWRTFEGEAERSFLTSRQACRGQPWEAMKTLLNAATEGNLPMRVHFVVHSSGMPWFLRLVKKLAGPDSKIPALATPELRRGVIRSISLLAPICSVKAISKLAMSLWGDWHPISIRHPRPLTVYCQTAQRDASENLAGYQGSFLELARRCFPLDGSMPTVTNPNCIAGHAEDSKKLYKYKSLSSIFELLPTASQEETMHADLMGDSQLMESVLHRVRLFSKDSQ